MQRLFWFLWRDPHRGPRTRALCSICGTAGLLRYDRTPKPAYTAFRGFTAETTPPVASITAGPAQGGFTKDPTPTFSFASNEPGSTFVCRFDAAPFKTCASPYTRAAPLSNGPHTFSVKAIDAPGNESAVVSRSFTVDTVAAADHDHLRALGVDHGHDAHLHASRPASRARPSACRFDSQAFAPCSGPGASHTPSTPLSLGSHSFEVRAIDRAKNIDPTPARRTFTVTVP